MSEFIERRCSLQERGAGGPEEISLMPLKRDHTAALKGAMMAQAALVNWGHTEARKIKNSPCERRRCREVRSLVPIKRDRWCRAEGS